MEDYLITQSYEAVITKQYIGFPISILISLCNLPVLRLISFFRELASDVTFSMNSYSLGS